MGDDHIYRSWFAWRSNQPPSSIKLLLFMVSVILVSGFCSFYGISVSRPWLWSSSVFFSTRDGAGNITSLPLIRDMNERESEAVVGLHPTVVVGVKDRQELAVSDEHSVSPSLPMEAVYAVIPVTNASSDKITISSDAVYQMTKNEQSVPSYSQNLENATASEAPSTSIVNDSIVAPTKSKEARDFTTLERLEASLQNVRRAIRDASNGSVVEPSDSDYLPRGPMYWNANIFHRSYLEMEKKFKVFVYREGEPPVFHNGPCRSIYSTEGFFIHRLEVDKKFRTTDPDKAHVFFLPFSVTMMVRFVYVRDSHDFGPIKRTVIDYIDLVSQRYPYWNRSLGADHFMLSCHDWGPEASLSVPNLQKNSIRALCNANTSERFNPLKDVSFPEINLQTGSLKGIIGGPSPSKRPILAFFAGGVHGPIRPIVLDHWEGKDEDIQVYKYLKKGVSYYDMMRKSRFCLCPSGYEVASPRIVEAIYTGCVPVLISEHYVPPFSDVLNWKSFSVEISVRDIRNLKKILMSISSRQYIRMQRRVVQVRKHFELNYPAKRFDVYHMILHSIWLRRLNVRINEDQ